MNAERAVFGPMAREEVISHLSPEEARAVLQYHQAREKEMDLKECKTLSDLESCVKGGVQGMMVNELVAVAVFNRGQEGIDSEKLVALRDAILQDDINRDRYNLVKDKDGTIRRSKHL
ncbi:MAG: hypothetical protein AAB546_00575 [Patescibacteria group bacterium]